MTSISIRNKKDNVPGRIKFLPPVRDMYIIFSVL